MHEANLCPLHKCARCVAQKKASGGIGGDRVREIRRFLDLVAEGTTSGSWKVQRRGLAHFAQYLEGKGARLPATEMDVALWIADCVKRQDKLDSSAAESYMAWGSSLPFAGRVGHGGSGEESHQGGRWSGRCSRW